MSRAMRIFTSGFFLTLSGLPQGVLAEVALGTLDGMEPTILPFSQGDLKQGIFVELRSDIDPRRGQVADATDPASVLVQFCGDEGEGQYSGDFLEVVDVDCSGRPRGTWEFASLNLIGAPVYNIAGEKLGEIKNFSRNDGDIERVELDLREGFPRAQAPFDLDVVNSQAYLAELENGSLALFVPELTDYMD